MSREVINKEIPYEAYAFAGRRRAARGMVLSAAMFMPLTITVVSCEFRSIDFNQRIGGHLYLAANASTIDLAKSELDAAISGIEESGLTNGSTHVLWKTPQTDIWFWYKNLTSSRDELGKAGKDTSQLERTNVLMKLRETILDHGENGRDVLSCPHNLHLYPDNTFYAVSVLAGLALLLYGGVMFPYYFGKYSYY